MTRSISKSARRLRIAVAAGGLIALATLGASLTLAGSSAASAAASPADVNLGTAGNFAVLAGSAITDVPTSSITGNVGVSPLTSNGLTCVEVTGTIYSVDLSGPLPCRKTNAPLLTTAKNDMGAAYVNAAGRTPFTSLAGGSSQLDGKTLVGGVYRFSGGGGANLTTSVTLHGSASDVWIFQVTNNLVFASSSRVVLTGAAQACHVFWQVGSDATLGTNSNISGTILAGTGITAQTGATISGRLLAATLVSLDHNTVIRSACASGGAGQQPPGRALYCAPNGQSYDLVKGEDTEPPYDALGLVPATINPVTGSASCSVASAATTTTAAATTTAATTTTAAPTPPPVTTTTPKPAPPALKPKGVKAAKHVKVAHVAPQPAKHTSGFTG